MQGVTSSRWRTACGSTVEVSGQHHGVVTIDFDWFEEGACIEAARSVSVEIGPEPMLHWECACCGAFSEPLVCASD